MRIIKTMAICGALTFGFDAAPVSAAETTTGTKPVVKTEANTVSEQATGSSSGVFLPLLLLVVVAAAAAGSSGSY